MMGDCTWAEPSRDEPSEPSPGAEIPLVIVPEAQDSKEEGGGKVDSCPKLSRMCIFI